MGRCRIVDLRCKEVINICDGCRLGFPCDVEVDAESGRLVAVVVPGPSRFLGLFGREEDYVIGWDRIKRIGDDVILVDYECHRPPPLRERRRFW
ncbi:MAG: YlmC/YmxH family sporulation protein [Oscillospiraceae bacterium]|jgi:YlmC/YmxH family sporulation protein|nr:YlmC/YmxH family sporulation protein [Oscillospiraceae bacterium]